MIITSSSPSSGTITMGVSFPNNMEKSALHVNDLGLSFARPLSVLLGSFYQMEGDRQGNASFMRPKAEGSRD